MLLALGLLIAGLVLLVKGADWLVDGASVIARRLGVTELAIGLTIVAFGTSLPELTVNIFSSLTGANDIAIGNIVGMQRVEDGHEKETRTLPIATGMMGAGLLLLVVGGKIAVDGAVSIATFLGVSQALIGLTVVAIGTSLPELATSVVA